MGFLSFDGLITTYKSFGLFFKKDLNIEDVIALQPESDMSHKLRKLVNDAQASFTGNITRWLLGFVLIPVTLIHLVIIFALYKTIAYLTQIHWYSHYKLFPQTSHRPYQLIGAYRHRYAHQPNHHSYLGCGFFYGTKVCTSDFCGNCHLNR